MVRDAPRPAPWTRWLLAAALAAVALLLMLVGSVWFILAEEGVAPPPRMAAEHATRVVRTSSAEAEPAAAPGDRLVVDVVDTAGEPAPGVVLMLRAASGGARRTATSDSAGSFVLEDLPEEAHWDVEAEPPWFAWAPSVLRSTVEARPQVLVVKKTCGGPVRVQSEDGTPFEGRVRDPRWGWRTLDAEGRADLPGRFCGPTRIRISEPRGTPLRAVTWQPADVQADEEVLLEAPPVVAAEVRVVDEAGAPVDVALHPGEAIGVGRFVLRGRNPEERVVITRPGHQPIEADIPLDGGVHEVLAPRDRTVAITLLCDACPQVMTCLAPGSAAAQDTCTGDPPDLTCTCPRGEAAVSGRSASALSDTQYDFQPLGRVPEGATAWTIDASGARAAIEATWTGASPCHVRLEREGLYAHGSSGCMADGSVLVSDLIPGEWRLVIWDVTGATASRTVVLESGETRRIGEMGPAADERVADTGG